jgi:hypothetical protein
VKHIGDILKDNHPKSRNNVIEIGIAPWGVVNERESLIGHGVNFCLKFILSLTDFLKLNFLDRSAVLF